jgi:DNA-binding transcriptional ArsR family regulator
VSDIASAFALAQPTVSNHIKILRQAGLVTDIRDGTRRQLAVQPDAVDELLGDLAAVLSDRADGVPGAPAAAH